MVASQIDTTQLEALLGLAARADEADLLAAATRSVTALLGDRGSVILVDDGAWVAFSTHAPKIALPIDINRYPEVLAALELRVPVVVEDVQRDDRMAGVRARLPPHVRSVAALPLYSGRVTAGVLHVQALEQRPLSAEAIATASFIATLTATLLETVRLRAQLGSSGLQIDTERTVPEPLGRREAVPERIDAERTDRVGAPARLLLVEDDPDQAESVTALLKHEGYEVTVATDGADALHLARSAPPNLILLDVGLPIVDGYAVAEQLSADALTCDIPILFLSAADDLMHRVRQLKLGAVDFLAKPYQLDALLARVERSLLDVATRERLRSAAYLDELTGLHNLRYLHERLAVEQARCQRYGIPMGVVMLDVDKLKQVNDKHGHEAGSQLLTAVGQVLRAGVRETDIAVRYGGDEFVVVLPHASRVEAIAFAERVSLQLGKLVLPHDIKASASIGVAAWTRGDGPIEALLGQADAAAYASKRRGGGAVTAAGPPPLATDAADAAKTG